MHWFPAPRSKVRHSLMFRLHRQEFKNHREVWAGGKYKGQGRMEVLLVCVTLKLVCLKAQLVTEAMVKIKEDQKWCL